MISARCEQSNHIALDISYVTIQMNISQNTADRISAEMAYPGNLGASEALIRPAPRQVCKSLRTANGSLQFQAFLSC